MLLLVRASPVPADVLIEGLNEELRDNSLLLMRLDDEPCDAPNWRISKLFKNATPAIEESLQAFGYYKPSINKSLSFSEDCWQASFEVEPGEPVRIRKVDIRLDGSDDIPPRLLGLIETQSFKRGDPLKQGLYTNYKKTLVETAINLGYFDAELTTRQLDIYSASLAADISLILTTGPRYIVGEIVFDQDTVDPELVRRYSNLVSGEPYTAGDIGNLYDGLLGSGYFESVTITTEPGDPPDHQVAVTVSLTAAKRRSIETGVGYGTDTGPKVRAGYLDRRRNRQGHQFETKAQWSKILAEISASYRIPLNNPRAEWLNFDAGYRDEDTETSSGQTVKLGVKELKLRPHGWLETRFIDFSLEKFDVASEGGTSRLVTPGLSWSHVFSSDPSRPKKGHRFNLRVNGTVEEIGSDTDFGQLDIYGKWVRGLWSGGRLLVRGEFGTTIKSNFSELPASVRYFVGGDKSVRGYDYETLGPRNSAGEVIGGSHKLTGSLEVDQLFKENWGIAVFVDAGNAFDDFSNLDLKLGAGVGLRWYSFLGPIRLDVAVPLESKAEDSFRIHINLGPDL